MPDKEIQYEVIHDAEMWASLNPDKVEIIHVLVSEDCPQFIFEVKRCVRNDKTHHAYISAFAIPMLHRIRDYIRENKIDYQPEGPIRFVFDLSYPVINPINPLLTQYYIPAHKKIATEVWKKLFFYDDRLGASNDEVQIMYYYFSVLMAADHPVFNRTLNSFISCLDKANFVFTTTIPTFRGIDEDTVSSSNILPPSSDERAPTLDLVYLYTDLIYFLSLIAEPQEGENLQKKFQNVLCDICFKTGIRVPGRSIYRGHSSKRICTFLKSIPVFVHSITNSLLDPPTCERPLNFIESLAMNQLKQLLQWYKLRDFYDCYTFAINPYTEAHKMPIIIEGCKDVITLYGKLQHRFHDKYIAYAGLFETEDILDKFNMLNRYPALLYAATKLKANNGDEKSDCKWRNMVALLPVDVPRMEIDLSLETTLNEKARQEAENEIRLILKTYVVVDIH